jgi:protein-S-isoprenylcysteine O-methyltransferase Ste14
MDRATLRARAWRGLGQFMLAMALMLFLPAWTLLWWQAWLFLCVFGGIVIWITMHFLATDPALIERRLSAGPAAEKEPVQKIIQGLASVALVAVVVVSSFDHRFGWSHVPLAVNLAGIVMVVVGLLIVFLVFRENSFTAAIVEVGSGQKVIATGPYSVARHPMYSGALVMVFGIPLALGSLWGLLPCLVMVGLIVARLLNEEQFLAANLTGYAEYRARIRARLVPAVW